MTIDEAIAHAREVKEFNIFKVNNKPMTMKEIAECEQCAEEHKQIAEWLEELKSYRASVFSGDMTKSMLKEERNKAIDDFYNALANDLIWIKERFGDDVYTDLWCDVGTRAEQLKAGGTSGTD